MKRAAELNSQKPKQTEVVVKQYHRSKLISSYAKRRANGICQLCGQYAPFSDENGNPYLETHHIVWLSQGGLDSVENTVALCPNCHKKMHVVNDEKDIVYLKNMISEKTIYISEV